MFCAGSRGRARIGTPSPWHGRLREGSKAVLGLGPPDPAFIARGEQNFDRFAAVLNGSLRGKTWLVGEQLTIADFSIGALYHRLSAWNSP